MNKKRAAILVASSILFLVLFMGFSPYNLPLFFVILPMIPLTTIVVVLTAYMLQLLHMSEGLAKKLTIVAGIIAGTTLVLLSLGQLTLKDFTILFLFGAIGTFYVSRMFSK